MPSKKKEESDEKTKKSFPKVHCNFRSPGPVHKLKTLVGYKEHCLSKWREPAYSFGHAGNDTLKCVGPGPKYSWDLPRGPAFSFPKDKNKDRAPCGPGPYMLPPGSSLAFSMTFKHPQPCGPPSPGPYAPSKLSPGPSYPFGLKAHEFKCNFNPPMYNIGPVCLTRPCPPNFSITPRRTFKDNCNSPGPIYLPKRLCAPKGISFGLKHSECETSNRTPDDDLC